MYRLYVSYLLITILQVKEVTVDYTDCKNENDRRCSEVISQNRDALCNCKIPFELQQDFKVGWLCLYT